MRAHHGSSLTQLKIRRSQGRGGSTPPPGTNNRGPFTCGGGAPDAPGAVAACAEACALAQGDTATITEGGKARVLLPLLTSARFPIVLVRCTGGGSVTRNLSL